MATFSVTKMLNSSWNSTGAVYMHPSGIEKIGGDIDVRRYVRIVSEKTTFVFQVIAHTMVEKSQIAMNQVQRGDLYVALQKPVSVHPFDASHLPSFQGIVLSIKTKNLLTSIDYMQIMANVHQLDGLVFRLGQSIITYYESKPYVFCIESITLNDTQHTFIPNVTQFHTQHLESMTGFLTRDTKISFSNISLSDPDMEFLNSQLDTLQGMISKNPAVVDQIKDMFQENHLLQNWDFEKLGVGGISEEFMLIFRRAFASRIYSPSIIKQFGIKHVKGILLYGPPGCGKTLLARKISTLLSRKNSVEPIVINGPEILNKYVGQSEENVRNLFSAAESDYKRYKDESPLHTIIFDEIDAICAQRGMRSGGSGVDDKVLTQLLTKIDGLQELNNILLIGMTNRPDMLDSALTRPGRFELKIEINLPNLKGRLEIFKIHTASMTKNNKLSEDVDLEKYAEMTENFTGAEIEGIVKNATSYALTKELDPMNPTQPENANKIQITHENFVSALEESKPAFGKDQALDLNMDVIYYNNEYNNLCQDVSKLLQQFVAGNQRVMKVFVHGEKGSGKTTFVWNMLRGNQKCFPMVKMLRSEQLVGQSDQAKCFLIRDIFNDLYKSEVSVLIIENLERIVEYIGLGIRFCNITVQTLLTYFNITPPKNHKLFLFITSSYKKYVWEDLDFAFDSCFTIPLVSVDDFPAFQFTPPFSLTPTNKMTVQRVLFEKDKFLFNS